MYSFRFPYFLIIANSVSDYYNIRHYSWHQSEKEFLKGEVSPSLQPPLSPGLTGLALAPPGPDGESSAPPSPGQSPGDLGKNHFHSDDATFILKKFIYFKNSTHNPKKG